MPINIVFADDHEVVRLELKCVFEGTDIHILAEAADGKTAFQLVKKHRPKLALLDVRMPETDGLSCLSRIKIDLPDVPVIMFSGFDNPTYLARSVALGAAGYLRKDA